MRKKFGYEVFVDKIYMGRFKSDKDRKSFKLDIQKTLKVLHPIGMSEDEAETYRARFKNSKVYVYLDSEIDSIWNHRYT